jgi:hypothetical protein
MSTTCAGAAALNSVKDNLAFHWKYAKFGYLSNRNPCINRSIWKYICSNEITSATLLACIRYTKTGLNLFVGGWLLMRVTYTHSSFSCYTLLHHMLYFPLIFFLYAPTDHTDQPICTPIRSNDAVWAKLGRATRQRSLCKIFQRGSLIFVDFNGD